MCELSRVSATVAALVANFEGDDDSSPPQHNGRVVRQPTKSSGRRPPLHPTSNGNHHHPIRRQRSGTSLQDSADCSVTVILPSGATGGGGGTNGQTRKHQQTDNSEESSTDSRNGMSCSPPLANAQKIDAMQTEQGLNSTSDCSEEDTSTCSDGDFTWICTQPESSPSPAAATVAQNPLHHLQQQSQQNNHQRSSTASPAGAVGGQKPQEARTCSSLDRRRTGNRALRDQKSRSTHTLRCDTWESREARSRETQQKCYKSSFCLI